jgi:hypothetical protein
VLVLATCAIPHDPFCHAQPQRFHVRVPCWRALAPSRDLRPRGEWPRRDDALRLRDVDPRRPYDALMLDVLLAFALLLLSGGNHPLVAIKLAENYLVGWSSETSISVFI